MYAYLLLIFLPADVFKVKLPFWGRDHSCFYGVLVWSHLSSYFWLSWCSPHISHWLDKCGTISILLLDSLMICSHTENFLLVTKVKGPSQFLCQRLLISCHGCPTKSHPSTIHYIVSLLFFFVPPCIVHPPSHSLFLFHWHPEFSHTVS